ncbi:MAG TPA: hypothetical protein VGD45_27540 [Steroidobacter sp.]|uniref:hypothetical protein n=1 Tax=Steroidobacter sp. TaxID=1978227 RepID=UPI002EDB8F59
MTGQRVTTCYPRVNAILDLYADRLGKDGRGYRNHVYRTVNYYAKLSGAEEVPESVQIAAAFHDIGIWTARSFDYLAPSVSEAQAYLDRQQLEGLEPEIRAMIEHHHKVRSYRAQFAPPVEAFRRADLVDLSVGMIRFGLPLRFVVSVKEVFPNAGFHRRLLGLAIRQFARQPWRPLPMLRW